MLREYYPAPKPVNAHLYSASAMVYSDHEKKQAEKLNITPYTYRKRSNLVREARAGTTLQVGDTVWPHSPELVKKYGKMLVQGICSKYDDYGDVEWNEPPFILQVAPLKDLQSSISCTAGYVQRTEPEQQGIC